MALLAALLPAAPLAAQTLAVEVESPVGVDWNQMWLDGERGRLFVSERSGGRILMLAADTLAPLGAADLTAFHPARPQGLVGDAAAGRVFVILHAGFATSDSTLLALDAADGSVLTVQPAVGTGLRVDVDPARDRVYTFGGGADPFSPSGGVLRAFDYQLAPLGQIDVEELMGSGLAGYAGPGGIHPQTGELLFSNLHQDAFAVVDGVALTGERVAAPAARGRFAIWNPAENKVCLTTAAWAGYFVYDRDDGQSSVTECINDGTRLFYSATTNRVYSGAEIDGAVTVIEGEDDSCRNVSVGTAHPFVAFLESSRRAYVAGPLGTAVLDEDSLAQVASLPGCGYCAGGGIGRHDIATDQGAGRVYFLSSCEGNVQGSCLHLFVDGGPTPPPGAWLSSPALPGFRVKARVTAGGQALTGRAEPQCIAETLCVSGALPGRPEVFVRVVGPRPNGYLWPTLVKFTPSRVELWIEQVASGLRRYYLLPAVDPGADLLDLAGVADRRGFLPTGSAATAPGSGGATRPPRARGGSAVDPPPPAGPWLTTAAMPGFRVKVLLTSAGTETAGRGESACIAEALCVSGALPGRPEVFVRVVGPRPNGYLWPTIVKFSTAKVEVWIEQIASGTLRYYLLPAVDPGADLVDLAGLADKRGFTP